MKNLKFGVLLFGVLGIVGLIMTKWVDIFKADKVEGLLMMVSFLVPTVMGAMGAAKPPFKKWQAGVAAAGFALFAVKYKIWEMFKGFGDAEIGGKIVLLSCVLGLIVSIVAIVKSEEG